MKKYKTGIKNDYKEGKNRWELLPVECVEEVVRVLTMGAKKYQDHGWKTLPNLQERYYAAALRHLVAWRKGQRYDNESKINHLSHALCSLMFVLWKDMQDEI